MISNHEKAKALESVTNALREYLEEDFLANNKGGQSVSCFRDLVWQYAGKHRGNKEAIEAAIQAVAVLIPGLDAQDHRAIMQKSP